MDSDEPGTAPVTWATESTGASDAQEIVRRFHDLYMADQSRTTMNTSWLGVRVIKCPLDLWVYQELMHRLRPDVIVECGTARGGSALFLASICDLIDRGRVITIDVWEPPEPRPQHARVTYLSGSSVAPQTLERVRKEVSEAEHVMVLLDSNHEMEHVLAELRAYAPLVTEGSYLVVEDTDQNAWRRRATPGPLEAVQVFLAEDDRFTIDRSLEKFMMTLNPSGFLRRQAG
jgi:cephalosporin hydroxylase